MSGAVANASDDEDDSEERHDQLRAPGRPPEEDRREESESPSRSMNPWSIAALTASRRPQLPPTGRLTSREQRARPLSPSSSTDISDSPSDSERGPCGNSLLSTHHRNRASVEELPHRPAAGVP